MGYFKTVLSGLAAILIAELTFFFPVLTGSKATGLAVIAGYSVESIFSLRFWLVGALLFGLFFTASRSRTVLRVLFFWVPTLAVSALGLAFLVTSTYLFIRFRHQ